MKITLTRYGLKSWNDTNIGNSAEDCRRIYSVRLVASITWEEGDDQNAFDENIFVYHARPSNDELLGDTFNNIASLQQMDDLPVGAPTEDEDGNFLMPFYRVSECSFNNYHPAQMEDTLSLIYYDVGKLQDDYNASIKLVEQETITFD